MINLRFYGVLILLGRLALVPAACTQEAAAGLEDVTWRLESYGEPGDLQPVISGTEITATFDGAQGKLSGSAGCNTYFAEYEVNGSTLSISDMANTEMYCQDPAGVMDQETRYLTILRGAQSFEVEDGKLQISAGAQVLNYVTD